MHPMMSPHFLQYIIPWCIHKRPGRRPWPWTRRCVGPVYPSFTYEKRGNHGKSWIYPCRNGEKMENHRKSRAALGVVYILMLEGKQQKLSIWRNDVFGQVDPQRVWNWERCRWTTGCDQSCRWNPLGGTAAWHSMGVYGYDDWIEHPVAPDPLACVPSSELQQLLIASWTSTN